MKFRITAGTNVGLRDNNEDNFIVSPSLVAGKWTIPPDSDQIFDLDTLGTIMAVADGMGGQNAGEVASAIAIETIQQMFAKDTLKPDIVDTPKSIKNYLRKVIIEADKRVKARTKDDPSTANMGSTLIIAWFINDVVYIAWIGDSRAYSIIPGHGIGRLSKDHSFVQQLVDSGKITEIQALSHPDNNIITRSLGDTSKSANPDVIEHKLAKGECILLCSDGLCGYVEDSVIGDIVENYNKNLNDCKSQLITTALKHGSTDNITVAICAIDEHPNSAINTRANPDIKKPNRLIWAVCGILAIICLIAFIIVYNDNKSDEKLESEIEQEVTKSPKENNTAPPETTIKINNAPIDTTDDQPSNGVVQIPKVSTNTAPSAVTNPDSIKAVNNKTDSIKLSKAVNGGLKIN